MRVFRSAAGRAPATGRRRGQTLIVLLVLLVMLSLVVLWNFDLHKIIAVKLRSQNAGDAAALAAARWQGTSLNLIGELNAMQALALHDAITRGSDDFSEAETIADLQARLCYVGPMTAFVAAQHAAKNNNVFVNNAFTADIAAHGRRVAEDYPTRFPEPPFGGGGDQGGGGWADYAEMVYAVAAEGIAAAPDNRRLYNDFSAPHLLLNPGFYDAIASRDWCWFLFNALDALQNYRNWREWDPLPRVEEPRPMNSEYFSLGLRTVETLEDLGRNSGEEGDAGAVLALLSERAGIVLTNEVLRVEARWYAYDPQSWRPWSTLIPENFPFRGPVREAYDYVGADAAVRIEQNSPRLTPGGGADTVMWTAAAKPFGTLDDGQAPNRYGLVLPAFSDVRLIPVDTSTASAGGSRPGWAEHIYEHLDPYVARGTGALHPGCWYCAQLYTWENSGFRQQGVLWLEANSEQCHQGGPGPGSPGGGSRRGH